MAHFDALRNRLRIYQIYLNFIQKGYETMHKYIQKFSPTPISVLIRGLYLIFCHTTFILLFANLSQELLPTALLARRCAAMLEYTAMSLVILLVGTMLLDLTLSKDDSR